MNINLVATTFDEIKQAIISKFKNDPKSPFKDYDYAGSALNYLMDILSYATFYNNYYSAVHVNELYLPYAKMDKNIMSLARSLGYIPRRINGASAYIRPSGLSLYNPDTTKDIVIPIYTSLKSQKGLNYILMEEIRYRYNTTINEWDLIRGMNFESDSDEPFYYKIKQGIYRNISFVPTQLPLQRVTIDKTNIDADRDSIIVQDSVTMDYWRPFYDISSFDLDKETTELMESTTTVPELQNELVADSLWQKYVLSMDKAQIFFINETEDATYIQFGDGQLGSIPTNKMDILYMLTEGEAGNGDVQFAFTGATSYIRTDGSSGTFNNRTVSVNIYPGTSASGGAPAESSTLIKNLACAFFNAQGRGVIEADYEVYLAQQNAVRLINVKAIGGEKLKPIIMGAVGICANKNTNTGSIKQSLLNHNDKELLKFILKNQNVVTINPVFINPEFIRVNLDMDVYYDPLKHDDSTVFNIVQSTSLVYLMSIQGFNKYFKYSHLVSVIDDLNEVDHNLIKADLEYVKVLQKKELANSLFINFGANNPIQKGTIGKIHKKTHFLKIFNPNVVYDTSNFYIPDSAINFIPGDYANVPKIFIYDLEEQATDNPNISNLILVEKMVTELEVQRIGSSNDAPFHFKYNKIESTGKVKIIGEISYNTGLIQLFLDDLSFRFMNGNKKSRRLALETQQLPDGSYEEIDAPVDAYSSYEDLFFYNYPFDTTTNLPLPLEKESTSEYFLEMAFDTVKESFQSEGNIIITSGMLNIRRHQEANKK